MRCAELAQLWLNPIRSKDSPTSPRHAPPPAGAYKTLRTERRQKLQDDGIRREQGIGALQRMIEGRHPRMPRIAAHKERNPIERIGKETPHDYRFGKP
jgi:hypothetical protein